MDVILVALTLFLAAQAKAQETSGLDLESYCTDFVNISSQTQCDEDCTRCFGPEVDQCFQCRPPIDGVMVEVNQLCEETSVAAEVMNMSAVFTVLNCSSQSNRMMIIIIAAAAGGGGGLLLCCLLLVCCCCCYCSRKRRKKAYGLQHNLEENNAVVPTMETSKDRDLRTETNGGNEFKMQFNLALSDNSTVPSHDNPLTPTTISTSFKLTAVTSYETGGKRGEDRLHSTASTEVTNLGDKGYVKMGSAGSIRDLSLEDPDENIYVEPDLSSPGMLLLLSQTTPKSPGTKHIKPATLPKPAALQTKVPLQGPAADDTAKASKGRSGSQSEVSEGSHGKEPKKCELKHSDSNSQCEDDYVSPAVFTEDLKKQRVEDYYNKDAVILPSLQKKSIKTDAEHDDTDPQTLYANAQTLYANVADTLNSEDTDDKPDKGSYESIKHYLGSDDDGEEQDPSLYYNVPDLGRAEVNEEEMYVYMKSGLTTEQGITVGAKVKERKRLQSEELGQSKKYVNYTHEQQQSRLDSLETKLDSAGKENVTEPMVEPECDSSEEAPLYANCKEEEEELYTEVS